MTPKNKRGTEIAVISAGFLTALYIQYGIFSWLLVINALIIVTASWYYEIIFQILRSLLWGGLVTIFIIAPYIVQPYSIPTGSMQPTFAPGSSVLVNKISCLLSCSPSAGDIIVFNGPDQNKKYIKRVAGKNNDKIQIKNGRVMVRNGDKLGREAIGYRTTLYTNKNIELTDNGDYRTISFSGRGVSIRGKAIPKNSKEALVASMMVRYKERESNYNILLSEEQLNNNKDKINTVVVNEVDSEYMINNSEPVYFVLGDNRHYSRDSRSFGSVPKSAIIGYPLIKYWPLFNYYGE